MGGNGTTYDANNVGYTYARIDREGEPGYFTNGNIGITIYVQASVAPYLYAFDADGKELNGSFPGELMTDTVNVNGTVFFAKTIRQTAPFNINILDEERYRTREIYVMSDRYFVYEGKNVYTDVTRQYFDAPDIEISSIALPGGHNTWDKTALMTEVEQGKKYTTEVDLTDVTLDENLLQFKLFANACAWLGFTSLTLDAPSYVYNIGDPAMFTDSRNFVLDLSQTAARKFLFEATWNGGYQMEEGWTLKITELNTVLEPYAVLTDNTDVISTADDGTVTYGKTLTFYYDNQKAARNGMSVGPFDEVSSWFEYTHYITSAVFDESMAKSDTITSTAYWFDRCNNLKTISNLRYLNTKNVTNMGAMFSECSSLTELDLSGFITDKVNSMGGMFSYCSSLKKLDLSNFNTENIGSVSFSGELNGMFNGCRSLESVTLTSFNTEKVKRLDAMFAGCSSLTTLDLSSFNTSNVTDFEYTFKDCTSLTTIYVSNAWDSSASNEKDGGGTFYNCVSIVGGKGTLYDENHTDYTYARIDGGPNSDKPGYFTEKNGISIDKGITIYVKADEAPYLYSWYEDGNTTLQPNGNWPGMRYTEKQTVNGVEFWYHTFSPDIEMINIIFR